MKTVKKYKELVFIGVSILTLWSIAVVCYASQSQADQISGKKEWKHLEDQTCSSGSSSDGG
jgi:hypothetical protein